MLSEANAPRHIVNMHTEDQRRTDQADRVGIVNMQSKLQRGVAGRPLDRQRPLNLKKAGLEEGESESQTLEARLRRHWCQNRVLGRTNKGISRPHPSLARNGKFPLDFDSSRRPDLWEMKG